MNLTIDQIYEGNTMNLNDYQAAATRTLHDEYPDAQYDRLCDVGNLLLSQNTLGLVGESGEFADAVKKMLYHDHGINRTELFEELGDVLWYVSSIATVLGFSLTDVARRNVEKLKSRYPEGFTVEDSKHGSD